LDKKIAQLEEVLQKHLEQNEQLLKLLMRKREALRGAEHSAVRQCTELEAEKLHAISELEKTRLQLVGDLTLMVEPAAREPLRMEPLAQRLPEPGRGRLLVLRAQLVERMQAVQQQSKVTQGALESLHRHMHGLIMTVSSVCSGVATYSATGARPRTALAVSTFSTTA
jgi:hypothetical protein